MNVGQHGIVAVAGAALLLALTNPGKTAYAEYVMSRFHDVSCKQERLQAMDEVFCQSFTVLPRGVARQVIQGYSYRQNYVFFSLYKTEFLGLRNRSFGILGVFYEI